MMSKHYTHRRRGDAAEGARLEKEEGGRQEKKPPLLCKRKNKSDSHLPKIQCLITDFTTVSTQSIARRMHVRNFEMQ